MLSTQLIDHDISGQEKKKKRRSTKRYLYFCTSKASKAAANSQNAQIFLPRQLRYVLI
jgi:hypothetical protein